jgi:hypothetical protein
MFQHQFEIGGFVERADESLASFGLKWQGQGRREMF